MSWLLPVCCVYRVCECDLEWGTLGLVCVCVCVCLCVRASPRLPLAGSTVVVGHESNAGQSQAHFLVRSRPRAVVPHQCSPMWCWTPIPPHPIPLLLEMSLVHSGNGFQCQGKGKYWTPPTRSVNQPSENGHEQTRRRNKPRGNGKNRARHKRRGKGTLEPETLDVNAHQEMVTRCVERRDKRVTVQRPVKRPQADEMSHRGSVVLQDTVAVHCCRADRRL